MSNTFFFISSILTFAQLWLADIQVFFEPQLKLASPESWIGNSTSRRPQRSANKQNTLCAAVLTHFFRSLRLKRYLYINESKSFIQISIFHFSYNIHGDCKGKVRSSPTKPTLLQWDLDEECRKTISSCLRVICPW